MTYGKRIVAARKKGLKIFIGFFALLFVEFFGLIPLIGGFAFLVMIATFIATFWYISKMTEPLLEEAGDLFERKMTEGSVDN